MSDPKSNAFLYWHRALEYIHRRMKIELFGKEERSDEDLEKHSTYILAPLTNVFSFFSTYLLISGQEMAMGQTKSLSKNDTSRMIR